MAMSGRGDQPPGHAPGGPGRTQEDGAGGISASEHAQVRALLGREPQGRYDIVVRAADGSPVVIRNAPRLDDGTPMPTRFWLVGRDEVAAVSRLESAGGVRAAEAAVDPAALAAAHARYADERDAALDEATPADLRSHPSGGVAGTRHGVKCLHAHYAWHLAGGDDPVGRWVADQFAARLDVDITADRTVVRHGGWSFVLAVNVRSLLEGELTDGDPPSPLSLTNALGAVTDHLDDAVRERREIIDTRRLVLSGDEAWHLACVERGSAEPAKAVMIGRDDLEDLFRTLATEARAERLHNPALNAGRVDSVVATCCTIIAIMRRLLFADAQFSVAGSGNAQLELAGR